MRRLTASAKPRYPQGLPSPPSALRFALLLGLLASPAMAQENVGAQKGKGQAATLAGFDLNFTLWESSGLDFSPEAYSNQLTLVFEPRYNLGKRLFAGRWAEPLSLSLRLLLTWELAGNDPGFRESSFASPTLLREVPEQVAIAQVQDPAATPYGRVDGAERRLYVSDLWVSLVHGRLATIAKLGVEVGTSLRVVLPTSRESRTGGLHAAPSLALFLHRKLRRFSLDYSFRTVKYFYSSTTAPIGGGPPGPVLVGGREIEPYRPLHSGIATPEWGFVNGFTVGVELPKGFSLDLNYFLFNVLTYSPGGCAYQSPGLPTIDLCGEGDRLGQLNRPGQRDSQWFLAELDWATTDWLTLGLGISTFQSVRLANGDLANPLFRVNRDNHTTLYLSLALNAEGFATALRRPKKP